MAEGGPSPKRAAASGVTLEVEVVRHDEAWEETGLTDEVLTRAAQAAFEAAPPQWQGSYQVAISLSGDEAVRVLNLTWRGKDAPTNVLSFPAEDEIAEPGFLGDVVLAYGTVLKEARERNIALQEHVSHLVVHGLLHLLGFDHADDAEAEQMESIERKALATLGIADPYADTEAAQASEAS
jgi:probable rRNA maturation factor